MSQRLTDEQISTIPEGFAAFSSHGEYLRVINAAAEELQAYRATLTLEEAQEYARAKREGRTLVKGCITYEEVKAALKERGDMK